MQQIVPVEICDPYRAEDDYPQEPTSIFKIHYCNRKGNNQRVFYSKTRRNSDNSSFLMEADDYMNEMSTITPNMITAIQNGEIAATRSIFELKNNFLNGMSSSSQPPMKHAKSFSGSASNKVNSLSSHEEHSK